MTNGPAPFANDDPSICRSSTMHFANAPGCISPCSTLHFRAIPLHGEMPDPSFANARPRICEREVREHEAVALDDLTGLDRERRAEHRAGVRERVKLAALAAGIDVRRQQRGIEVAAGELA